MFKKVLEQQFKQSFLGRRSTGWIFCVRVQFGRLFLPPHLWCH